MGKESKADGKWCIIYRKQVKCKLIPIISKF